ncbi:uncharacterized protein LOC9632787 isoform X1 [Selaginella moellendorffii]|uniref:uncharacterized protein LOC9632787 isoform X1 n=1 Tax=Selaginella moellendorffii TaxID=88036 RepID=UPI000D1C2799|nr:uncharacterized protein LOC9632787 isoform X1 [Selaginella moellendorffii]|eukprot:XP_024526329.1 uncharacterized protein LOC9632787 isoform X1 [Selaginella moellendorffii]
MATSAPSSARLTVSSCTFFDRSARSSAMRVRASIAAATPYSSRAVHEGGRNPLALFENIMREVRPLPTILEEMWKMLAPEKQLLRWRRNAGVFSDLPGSRKGFLGAGIIDGSGRRIPGGGLLLRGTRRINRPFDYLRVPNMTFPKRERKRRYFSKKLEEKESDKGWHPELCTYESEFAKQHALYFYNLLAFPWEKGAFERFVDKLERKYFPEDHIDALVPPLDKEPKAKAGKSNKDKKLSAWPSSAQSSSFEAYAADASVENVEDTSPTRPASGSIEISPDDWEPEASSPDTYAEAVSDEKPKRKAADTLTPRPPVITRTVNLPEEWDGPLGTVVLIDKPHGWTSFSVCAKLRKLLKIKKVGHAGTLDPMATGLLIVCVGKATKFTDSYQAMKKFYSGTLRLGEATPSYDGDTLVSERMPWEHVTDEDMQIVKEEFVGTIRQVPPLYSALKVNGRTHHSIYLKHTALYIQVEGERLYEKARRGETFQIPPRIISIEELQVERDSIDRQNFHFKVACSKGTYVRSLCYDLGRALNTCAHLVALRRDKIGEFSVDDAWTFSELGSNFADDFLGRACSKTPPITVTNMSLEDAWEFPELQESRGDDDDF